MLVKREKYLKQIRPYYEVDLIKVITGVRRAGKSVLLETIKEELKEQGIAADHIISINLEDFDYEYIETASDLHRELKLWMVDKEKYYIFIDEIQHVENFEKVLASLRATANVSLFVTGSNSTLLSGELATLLTGRTIEFEVLPFSFYEYKEYLELNNKIFSENMFFDYLKWGGFPMRIAFNEEFSVRRYLETLYKSIITRDVIAKRGRLDRKAFQAVALYIFANAGKEFSAENIAAFYGKNNDSSISVRSIYSYIERLEKAYLLHRVQKFNIVGKNALKNRDKFYAIDNGFRTINTNGFNIEDTFFLENVIYNELLYQGFQVYVGQTYKGEVDFVAIKDGKKCFIQVCYLLASDITIQREFSAFRPITDSSPKYVLSLDKIDFSRNGIIHLNIVDFLLHKKELMLS